jgi:hypothetical protein
MAALVEFPYRSLIEGDHDWNIVGNTMGSGQTTGASVDVRSDGGGFWMASLNNIRLRSASDTKLWRAIRNIANGGVTPLIVTCQDTVFAPFPTSAVELNGITHSDGTLFSDGTGYAQSIIDVTCNGGAALRATSMTMNLNYCGHLQGGEKFAIAHQTFNWRLYEIGTVIQSGSVATITFNPPLREAVADGERLEFDRPRCTMKLVNAAAMNLNVTTYPFPLASVKFVESKYAT